MGRLCKNCHEGYHSWFGECLPCPDPFGWTPKNTLTAIYRYGIIWVLWMTVNRFLYPPSHTHTCTRTRTTQTHACTHTPPPARPGVNLPATS